MAVSFEFDSQILKIEKINENWAKLILPSKPNYPTEVLITRDKLMNSGNADILAQALKGDKIEVHLKGNLAYKNNQWAFVVNRSFEAIPMASEMTESELDDMIAKVFK